MWFLLKKKWFWLTLLVIFLGNIIWPVRSLFSANFLFNTHLVVLTNEAELRPCGGFVTVYGRVRILPPKIELKNVYALKNAEFGEAPDPINQVSNKMRFWDLGINSNLAECTESFAKAAKTIDLQTDDVILLDISTAEEITDDKEIFAKLTRAVANTDRHDEQSLKERKSPLVGMGKKIIWNTLLKPWRWSKISREIEAKIQNGNIYISDISPVIKPKSNDFAFYEWNLGGGKSSRFLDKKLKISAREVSPDNWKISGEFNIDHVGQSDEPLSQDWKGVFELEFPARFGQETMRFPAKLAPGQNWVEKFSFNYDGKLEELSVFNQRGQTIFLDLTVSLFGQQTFAETDFENHENIGKIYKKTTKFREKMSWLAAPDKIKPFITLHEWAGNRGIIPEEFRGKWSDFFKTSSKQFNFAEIHFSEPIDVNENTFVEITDKNFENKEITDDPIFEEIILFNDRKTALIGFWQNQVQPNERFFIEFRGIFDSFGNEISLQKYTIIDRISQEE